MDMGRWMDALNSPSKLVWVSPIRLFNCYSFSFWGGKCFSVNINI
jgi:hypothetical protein